MLQFRPSRVVDILYKICMFPGKWANVLLGIGSRYFQPSRVVGKSTFMSCVSAQPFLLVVLLRTKHWLELSDKKLSHNGETLCMFRHCAHLKTLNVLLKKIMQSFTTYFKLTKFYVMLWFQIDLSWSDEKEYQ